MPIVSGGGGSTGGVAISGVAVSGNVPVASGASAGVWAFPPGYEIGYDQATVTVTVSSATEATGTTVLACAAHTFDGAPVLATFFCPRAAPGTSDQLLISLFEGATQIGRLGLLTTATNAPVSLLLRFTPTAAAHTYTVTASRSTQNGSMICGAGGTGTEVPMFMRFTKV